MYGPPYCDDCRIFAVLTDNQYYPWRCHKCKKKDLPCVAIWSEEYKEIEKNTDEYDKKNR